MPLVRVGPKMFEWMRSERRKLEEQTKFIEVSYSKLSDEVAEFLKSRDIGFKMVRDKKNKKNGFRLF